LIAFFSTLLSSFDDTIKEIENNNNNDLQKPRGVKIFRSPPENNKNHDEKDKDKEKEIRKKNALFRQPVSIFYGGIHSNNNFNNNNVHHQKPRVEFPGVRDASDFHIAFPNIENSQIIIGNFFFLFSLFSLSLSLSLSFFINSFRY
jgi:hypothetical protein